MADGMTRDPYRYFRVEARELLDQLAQGTLDLEKGAVDPDGIARFLRLAHTLKGAARVVRQRTIADAAHALEDALMRIRDANGIAGRDEIDAALAHLDSIEGQLRALAPAPATPSVVSVETAGAASAPPAHDDAVSAPPAFRPDVVDLEALLRALSDVEATVARLPAGIGELEQVGRLVDALAQASTRQVRDTTPSGTSSAARLRAVADDLRSRTGAAVRELRATAHRLHRDLREVRHAAERLRLVPVASLLTYLERVVRDAAQATGAAVQFRAIGGDLRLDSAMLDVVQPALLQIVRNAVVHGIEPAADRGAAGKPAAATVTVAVWQRAGRVTFACTDDGRGIDLPAVRALAKARGVAGADTASADTLLRMLLHGGISTAGQVNELAGRGVGLDVVRAAAARLGGEATVRTEAGAGTTMALVVPMSIASFDAMVVEASVTAGLPFDAVRAAMRVAPESIVHTEGRQTVMYEGQPVPLAPLPLLLGRDAPAPAGAVTTVIVEGASGLAAVGVNRIAGLRPLVMQPLPPGLEASPLVAGAALDAGGAPQIVLDPDALVAAVAVHTAAAAAAQAAPRVLVIDDSLTTRMLEQSILESAGYAVETARSAEEGLAMARRGSYALFLVDVEMPGMDGFSFVEEIRRDPPLRHIPAILVTSRMAPEDKQRGRAAGAQDYMVKSEFDQDVLLSRIRELVR